MSRQRLTWTRQADAAKTASPPPQIPAVDRTEGPVSPAYLPDPPADKYQTGDTSTWAEDPRQPPYPEGPPPAMPGIGTTEEATHPATITPAVVAAPTGPTTEAEADARAPKAASEIQLKQAAENKAAVCVRIAQATLKDATVADIEKKAMALMDLPDAQIAATAATLNITAEDDEDQDEASDDDDDAKMSNKKATQEITARLEKMERQTSKLVKSFSDFFGMDDLMDDDEVELDMMIDDNGDMSDEELMATLTSMADDIDGDGIDQSDNAFPGNQANDEFDRGEESEGTEMYDEGEMLASLMAELSGGHMASDAELAVEPLAKGPSIQSGEGGNVNPDPAPVTPEVEQMDGAEKTADVDGTENDIQLSAGVDPMGLMDDSTTASGPNDELLALYADLDLPKTAKAKKGDDEEDEEEEDDDADTDEKAEADDEEYDADDEGEKAAGKKKKAAAAQRPQPKKASTGPKTIGAVPQTKKAQDEIAELSAIWEQAPDVREFFGIPK